METRRVIEPAAVLFLVTTTSRSSRRSDCCKLRVSCRPTISEAAPVGMIMDSFHLPIGRWATQPMKSCEKCWWMGRTLGCWSSKNRWIPNKPSPFFKLESFYCLLGRRKMDWGIPIADQQPNPVELEPMSTADYLTIRLFYYVAMTWWRLTRVSTRFGTFFLLRKLPTGGDESASSSGHGRRVLLWTASHGRSVTGPD